MVHANTFPDNDNNELDDYDFETSDQDTLVLLGRWVKEWFNYPPNYKVVFLTHPAGVFGPVNKAAYISDSIYRIKTVLIT